MGFDGATFGEKKSCKKPFLVLVFIFSKHFLFGSNIFKRIFLLYIPAALDPISRKRIARENHLRQLHFCQMCRTGEEMGKRWHFTAKYGSTHIAQLFQNIDTSHQIWFNKHEQNVKRNSTDKNIELLILLGLQAERYSSISTFLVKMESKTSLAFHIWHLKNVRFNFNLRAAVQPAWYLLRVHFSCTASSHLMAFCCLFWPFLILCLNFWDKICAWASLARP